MVGILGEHRKLQTKPCQWGAQIMADARQHVGALLHMAVDAFAHLDEGMGGTADFGRAIGLEAGKAAAFAEIFCGPGETLNRLYLIAQEQRRNGDQNKRRAKHPKHEYSGDQAALPLR